MSNIRELKQRIGSVIKTKKMTQAMKMVAAAKFKRAAVKTNNIREYMDGLDFILQDMINRMEPDELPLFFFDNQATKQAVIVIAGDRGLCGGFNSSVLRAAEAYLREQNSDVELYLFGNKACTYFKNKGWPIGAQYPYFLDGLDFEKVENAFDLITGKFLNGEVGMVKGIFNKFQSALNSELIERQYLPIITEKSDDAPQSDYIYEMNRGCVMQDFIHLYLVMVLFQDILDSNSGEEAARMMAMEAAADNASQMIEQLKLVYNRSRQSAITREINEIVSGVEALN